MGDILILAILIIATFLGYKKGFLRTLTGVISIIISFVIAVSFSPQIEDFIKNTPVYEAIYENIEETIGTESEETTVSEKKTAKLNMPRDMIESIHKNAEDKKSEIKNSMTEKIGEISVKILSIVFIFLIVRILLFVILGGFGLVKKLPFIGWFDRLLGAFFGFLRGFLVVYLLLVVVTVCASFNAQNGIVKTVKQSEFAKVMYNNNVFLDFIYKD